VVKAPDTRFARLGSQRIAYQVVGEGPMDVVFCTGVASNIDHLWDEPDAADVLRSIASYSRVILFDPRGAGASDPLPPAESFGWELWIDDLRAVLDTVGSERAAILAYADGCQCAMLFAATTPARTTALVLTAGTARYTSAEDYPIGFPPEQIGAAVRQMEETWATEAGVRFFWPSRADDPRFRNWWVRYQRGSANPSKVEELWRQIFNVDSRHALPLIDVPTLVVATESPVLPADHGRFIADHIGGAELVVVPTKDLAPWFSHPDECAALIERFLTGKHKTEHTQRKLATVVFTDIVGSTDRAAELGDRRWRRLLDEHDEIVRDRVDRFGGEVIKMTGDGALATFDGPAKAIRCTLGLRDALAGIDVRMRCGLHAGEVEVREADVGGMAVHIAARVMSEAKPDEILASSTVRDLVVGSGMTFSDRGMHVLKGIPDAWRLYAVESV
jgi:class 3 adenylate cyclase